MEDVVLVQLEEEEQLELEQLGGGRDNDHHIDYDYDEEEDEELMNEGSFLLSETRRFKTMLSAGSDDIESSDENAAIGGGARNNRRRPDLRLVFMSCHWLKRVNVAVMSSKALPRCKTVGSVASVSDRIISNAYDVPAASP